MTRTFPDGFLWGTGTSAYQVEGAWDADGKVPSIWDEYSHNGASTPDGTSGDVAIDQYHRLDEDLDLLSDLGAPAYRFSISWPRIVPDASAAPNRAGLDYYDRLIDGLLERGLVPVANLYHWDTPVWAEELGGWMSRDTADRFGEYAAIVGERFGDRVAQWYTMNEPTHPTLAAYVIPALPPQAGLGADGLASVHNILLAHGNAVRALHGASVSGDIGMILSHSGFQPATTHPDDIRAAELANHYESIFLSPVLGHGHLPELREFLSDRGLLRDGDENLIAQPIDAIGLNWYSRYAAASPQRAQFSDDMPKQAQTMASLQEATTRLGFVSVPVPGNPWTGAHRQHTPGGLLDALRNFVSDYADHPRIYITENGIGDKDLPGSDGTVHDTHRLAYLERCLGEVHQAISEGIDVGGYFVWSSFDNFQWTAGFTQRFGMIHVDPASQVRTPKSSFHWYKNVVARNGLPRENEFDVAEEYDGDAAGVEIPGVRNARGIGGLPTMSGSHLRSGLYFRTGSLAGLTEAGRRRLQELGVTAVVDLRDKQSIEDTPDRVDPAVSIAAPVFERIPDAQTFDFDGFSLADTYLDLVSAKGPELVGVLKIIASHTDGAILVHCDAGKDRTGLVTALLLGVLGVTDAAILSNYAESGTALGSPFLDAINEAIAPRVLTDEHATKILDSDANNIVQVFDVIRREFGSITAYTQAHGLTPAEIDALRTRFIAD